MPTTVTRRTLFERDERGRLSGAIDVTIDAPPPREEPEMLTMSSPPRAVAAREVLSLLSTAELERLARQLGATLPPVSRVGVRAGGVMRAAGSEISVRPLRGFGSG